MRYRLTCLTPLLVGDGFKLSPIDYMVWKDQINVLDQRRIFRLLAKGPRLDSYLTQIRKADKLDFASWGGFAQNFAGRRIPFEHPAYTSYWERLRAENLHIPTFVTGTDGPYVPGSAVKGALRTAMVFANWDKGALRDLAGRLQGDRLPRQPGQAAEERAVGASGQCRLKLLAVADSAQAPVSCLKVHLLRVASLEARGGGHLELGWKQIPRGTVDGRRPDDSTPLFAEMAEPGTIFEGIWTERSFYRRSEIVQALRWKQPPDSGAILAAANTHASSLLAIHLRYAEAAGLSLLTQNIQGLLARLADIRQSGTACLLPLGWGGGFLGKAAHPDTEHEDYRLLLRQHPLYAKAIRSGLPFPKTRRVVFLKNQPAALPGWALLEIE